MSAFLTKRRTSQEAPTRRISGPLDGSFQHINSAMTDLASPINYGTLIASTSTPSVSVDAAKNKVSWDCS